ncbi:MAG: hypothetical protein AUJ39_01400 [Parcubacteria group bacterium CG1_02_42_13]|nr:MAG: hypothetical protein AUJ39_01400 [Parcubacteria group bacterium CG1_02_42_13]
MFKWVKIILVIILLAAFAFLIREYGFDLGGSDVFEVILKGEKFMVEAADTPAERMQGLSGRSGLSVNEGMLFTFDKPDAHGFWMKDMKFPIDIIWISNNEVIYVSSNLNPDSYPTIFSPPEPVSQVLEVKAGTILRLNVVEGDKVFINGQ